MMGFKLIRIGKLGPKNKLLEQTSGASPTNIALLRLSMDMELHHIELCLDLFIHPYSNSN